MAFGTRGDVQPLLALGVRLRADGHEVVLGASRVFAEWVRGHGLEFRPVGQNIEDLLQRHAEVLMHPARSVRPVLEVLRQEIEVSFDPVLETAQGADLLVSGLHFASPSVAEALGIPHRTVIHCPQMLRSRYHPPPGVARLGLPGTINRLLWNTLANAVDIALGDTLNLHRRRRGLPPVASVMDHLAAQDTIVASDPILGEVPPDLTQAVPQTGAIVLADEAALDPALEQFLDRGEPPIYVGFGSMPGTDPRGTTFAIAEALAASGRRGVISSGWAGLGRGGVPPGVFVIGPVPHAALLPRVALAVHHGGAGTTAAAARAGVPQVVVPHLADQFYWAHQVHRLGLGSRPVPRRSLTASRLGRAIKAVLSNPETAARAQATRECLVRSDGLAAVARLVGQALEERAAHPHAA